ncbi:MAG: hypothetical protein ACLP0B_17925 [Steroidobacteraceae bacterium]|jgi:hypothetical protein
MTLDAHEYSAVVKSRKGVLQPDLVNSIALKTLTREQAEAEGWPTYYVPSACVNGHVAARFCKNDLCVSCWLIRQGRDPLYPTAKNRTYRKEKPRDPSAPVAATGAPVTAPAAPSQPELKPVRQRFLAELAESRSIDAACAAVPGFTKGILQSALSTDPAFKTAFQDLTDRLGIATRAPDDETRKWNPELEKAFTRLYVDCGLIEQTRTELGISASDFHAHLAASPAFAALVAAAEPLARTTLRDRATKEASAGNDRLLKILEVDEPTDLSQMSTDELNSELRRLIEELDRTGVIPHTVSYRRLSTGEILSANDLQAYETTHSRSAPASDANLDLVGA